MFFRASAEQGIFAASEGPDTEAPAGSAVDTADDGGTAASGAVPAPPAAQPESRNTPANTNGTSFGDPDIVRPYSAEYIANAVTVIRSGVRPGLLLLIQGRGVGGEDAGPVQVGGEVAECAQGDTLAEGAVGDPGYSELLQFGCGERTRCADD